MLLLRGGGTGVSWKCSLPMQLFRSYGSVSKSSNCSLQKLRVISRRMTDQTVPGVNSPVFTSPIRQISFSDRKCYESIPQLTENHPDMKLDAIDIFTTAIRAVRPKAMIENVLHYNEASSTLTVEDKVYKLNRNVYVVGLGKAAMGMARVVEDVLGSHVVEGIISIPKGLQEEMRMAQNREMLLAESTKITVYEGAENNEADEDAYKASKEIQELVSRLEENDLLIVLLSGGGSPLCPSPHPSITLEELQKVSRLLTRAGATHIELNTLRKNLETLKGGGLAMAAKPAKVLSLILSSVIDDPKDIIASGPTCPTQPTPHHCIEILKRLDIMDKTPNSIRQLLYRECMNISMQSKGIHNPIQEKAEQDAMWNCVQNIIVGNNSVSCEAAAARASDFGYLPLILTKDLSGEARKVGFLYAKLAKFIMMCFDRKSSYGPNKELAILETQLVLGGIRKTWINHICNTVDRAHNMNKDLCIIAGGETVVHVCGTGMGGKNMEAALAAAIQMQEEFRVKEMPVAETRMVFLSGDSDGLDGVTPMAGALVDQDFLDKVAKSGLDMMSYLDNNDSYTFFQNIDGGGNLVRTNLTGTNVMDIVVMLVQKPKEQKYQWS